MRSLRILLALLTVLGSTVANAQTWTPVNSEFDQSVVVKTYKTVNWRFGGGSSWDVRSRPAGEYRCTVAAWTSSPTNGINPRTGNGNYCEIDDATALQPVVVAPPTPFIACLPELKADVWNISYKTGSAPFADYPNYVVWQGKASCGGKVQGQLYSNSELAQFLLNKFKTDAEVNAWTAAQPVVVYTQAQKDFLLTVKTAYAETIIAPAATCKITPQSATVLDRAVYKLNSAGTGVGSALTGVRVLQGTPCGLRLGTTNYYSVAGQKDTQGRVIAAGYAIGVVN